MDTIKIGEFLKVLRKAKGYTQEEVATQLVLSPKTISRWESGNGIPDINIISAVADLYDVTVDEILKGERYTEKQSRLSEQTSKMKNDSKVKVIMNNVIHKYHIYFITSISIIGVTLLLAIIFGFTISRFIGMLLMFLGLAIGGVIIVIANSEVKRILADNSEESLAEGIEKTNREIRRKNVLFLDLLVATIAMELIIFFIFLTNGKSMINEKNVLLVGPTFIIVLLICYFTFRKYYSNYESKNDLKKLNGYLSLIAIILAFFAIIFLINARIKTKMEVTVGGFVTIEYSTWIVTYFYNLEESYLFRGIGIGLLVLSFSGLIISIKHKNILIILVSTIIGIISSLLSTLDVEYNQHFINIFPILALFILFMIIAIVSNNKKEIRKIKI